MRLKGWKEIPKGGTIIEAGNSEKYNTGDWRSSRPVVNKKKCINCLTCWVFCPDSSIYVKDEKQAGFDYDHCKGCGVCASECPVKCIDMIKENDYPKFKQEKKVDDVGRYEK